MSGTVHQKTKDRVDKLAYILVLMERGEYEFPDGRRRWRRDESGIRHPRVVRRIAFEQVWGSFSTPMYSALFSETGRLRPLLEERIAYHRQRLDSGYRKALAELTGDGKALEVMSAKVYESLWWDLNDPETCRKIPFRDRVKFFEILAKLDASIKGDVMTKPSSLKPSVVIQNINVPESVKQRMVERMEEIEGEAEEEETPVGEIEGYKG